MENINKIGVETAVNTKVDLSVVMSVFNGEEHLEESIKSILLQTYSDFEFIIVNDGSTDRTKAIIDQYAGQDSRIVPVLQENMGLAKSLNNAIQIARGKYIARQDADDVSGKNRLQMQMEFMNTHPDIVLCGTWFVEVNEGRGVKVRKNPIGDEELRKNNKYTNNFCHSSIIFVKSAFDKADGYDERFESSEDLDLWIRLMDHGKACNLPNVLVKKRIGFGNSMSWRKRHYKIKSAKLIYEKYFNKKERINLVKLAIYVLPWLIYPLLPICIVKCIRRFRYRKREKRKPSLFI